MGGFSKVVILEARSAFLILQQCFEWQLCWMLHTVCSLMLIKCLELNWNVGQEAILYDFTLVGNYSEQVTYAIWSTSLTPRTAS